jgi:hypothetical protein
MIPKPSALTCLNREFFMSVNSNEGSFNSKETPSSVSDSMLMLLSVLKASDEKVKIICNRRT